MTDSTDKPAEDKPATAAAASASLELNRQIGDIQTELKKLEVQFSRGSWITGIVGGLLLLAMCVYFTIGYKAIAPIVLDPSDLFSSAQQMLEDNAMPTNLEEIRRRAQREITKNAPIWAGQISQQLTDNVPTIRETLEDYIIQQLIDSVDQYASVSENKLRATLQIKENRDLIQSAFDELGSNSALSTEKKAEFKKALFAQLQLDVEEQASLVLETLKLFNQNFTKLKEGKELDKAERTYRLAVSNLKRLQMEMEDPSLEGTEISYGDKSEVPKKESGETPDSETKSDDK